MALSAQPAANDHVSVSGAVAASCVSCLHIYTDTSASSSSPAYPSYKFVSATLVLIRRIINLNQQTDKRDTS